MKDPIIDHINNNREDFENKTPQDVVWDNIEKELHPKEKKNAFPWLKIAAGIALLIAAWGLYENFLSGNSEQENLAKTDQRNEIKVEELHDLSPNKPPAFKIDKLRKNLNPGTYNVDTDGENFSMGRVESFTDGADKEEIIEITNSDLTTITYSNIKVNENQASDKSQSYAWTQANPQQRKVIRGASFKDLGYYSDTISGYVGYRNVVSHVGRGNENQLTFDPAYYYEQYDEFKENDFESVGQKPLSTFGIDVDAAGYSNMRRYLNDGYLPPKNAVKLEEMVNYFDYNLKEPTGKHPFRVTNELGICPWNKEHQLLSIAIKGKNVDKSEIPPSNLVFLLDVSGSMSDANKLPLLKQGFKMLVDQLREEDRVSIVVYAGAAGVVLKPTSGANKNKILEALNNLEAGGSTAGGQGINLAYKLAQQNFKKGGNNRIVLATDGDFNVGVSDDASLVKLIEEKRKSGIFLSVFGFGTGNLQSSKMEKIADNGNGNYAYIDNLLEAKKVLVTEFGGTIFTIAKDVKLQLEFNPNNVESYRLLGYENRILADKDFDDDTKDAGDLGAGHSIIALYEIIPSKEAKEKSKLKYSEYVAKENADLNGELLTLSIRYKQPDQNKSVKFTKVMHTRMPKEHTSTHLFASAVAEFGLLLRDSEYKGSASYSALIERARFSKGKDLYGYRSEFIQLAEKAELIWGEYNRFQQNLP